MACYGGEVRFWLLVIGALSACDTSLDGTAFKCRTADGCPAGQMCFGGRCRTVPAVSIACGAVTCGPEQQCCTDRLNGDRCIPAIDDCVGSAALCDGRDDCAAGETCCNQELTRCSASCEEPAACTTPDDCPSATPNCCPQVAMPWGQCQLVPC